MQYRGRMQTRSTEQSPAMTESVAISFRNGKRSISRAVLIKGPPIRLALRPTKLIAVPQCPVPPVKLISRVSKGKRPLGNRSHRNRFDPRRASCNALRPRLLTAFPVRSGAACTSWMTTPLDCEFVIGRRSSSLFLIQAELITDDQLMPCETRRFCFRVFVTEMYDLFVL